jgi:hypothetical protein
MTEVRIETVDFTQYEKIPFVDGFLGELERDYEVVEVYSMRAKSSLVPHSDILFSENMVWIVNQAAKGEENGDGIIGLFWKNPSQNEGRVQGNATGNSCLLKLVDHEGNIELIPVGSVNEDPMTSIFDPMPLMN